VRKKMKRSIMLFIVAAFVSVILWDTTRAAQRVVVLEKLGIGMTGSLNVDELLHVENTTADGNAAIALENDANQWLLRVETDESLRILDTSTVISEIENGATTYGGFHITSSETVINEGGNDQDVRVEASGEANALFVQGSDGNVGIGTTSPAVGLHGVVTAGKFLWADSEADNNDKALRLGTEHYDVDEEPVFAMVSIATTAANTLNIGGGTALGNAATMIKLFTAANNTTTTGTERMRIDSSGYFYFTDRLVDLGDTDSYIESLGTGYWHVYGGGSLLLNINPLTVTLGNGVDLWVQDEYVQFTERSAPAAPSSNQAYLFSQDNGSGKTQLCALFATGAVQCFATEPP